MFKIACFLLFPGYVARYLNRQETIALFKEHWNLQHNKAMPKARFGTLDIEVSLQEVHTFGAMQSQRRSILARQ